MQKAANFGQTVPGIGEAANADFNEMLDAEAYANAYDPLIDELESLRQIVRKAVALRRLKSAPPMRQRRHPQHATPDARHFLARCN